MGGSLHVARYRCGAAARDARRSRQREPRDSVHADDVDAAYAEAQKQGYEIVHPLTTEAWGVRRFLVRAPDGNVINIVQHRG